MKDPEIRANELHPSSPPVCLRESHVRNLFASLETGSGASFFDHVSDDVDWTVKGTHALAGHYTNKETFMAGAINRLNRVMPNGVQIHVKNVFIVGDWAIVELYSLAHAKNGMRYNNEYAWFCRFDRNLNIVQVRAYLDSALVQKVVDQHLSDFQQPS